MPQKGDQEKTEKPTPKKLADARKKGQVPKSPDVSSAFILLGSSVVLLLAGPWMFWALNEFMHGIFANLGTLYIEGDSARAFLFEIFEQVLIILLPLMVVLVIVGVGANLIQVGFLFTFEPFTPKLSKFNPITGMKKFFSIRALVDRRCCLCSPDGGDRYHTFPDRNERRSDLFRYLHVFFENFFLCVTRYVCPGCHRFYLSEVAAYKGPDDEQAGNQG